MASKVALYDTLSEWEAKNDEISEALGLPENDGAGPTMTYAEPKKVNNPENGDFGKYYMPITAKGTWKADHLFDESEKIDPDDSWFLNELIDEDPPD